MEAPSEQIPLEILKVGRGDFSRPLEREAKASPTQQIPPNPPLLKGGEGGLFISFKTNFT